MGDRSGRVGDEDRGPYFGLVECFRVNSGFVLVLVTDASVGTESEQDAHVLANRHLSSGSTFARGQDCFKHVRSD